MTTPADSPLGKTISQSKQYDKSLLFPIPRQQQRESFSLTGTLPFYGFDSWMAFELSWLNNKGKPMVSMAEIRIPCDSPNLIESKSLKLYLNSFNQTHFDDAKAVQACMESNLSDAAGAIVKVTFLDEASVLKNGLAQLQGECLDSLDIQCDTYLPAPELLSTGAPTVTETLYSHLFRSNCPVTGQPDWASLSIQYHGPQIDKVALLRYIVSYRQHQDFHEHCVEQIFLDIKKHCKPTQLTVFARFTRRGGLDINPYRSSQPMDDHCIQRLFRQ